MVTELLHKLSNVTMTSQEVAEDITLLQFTVVNACIVGKKGNWVLVDTGMANAGNFIVETAEKKFGEGARPKAIILTHGHFDHVGSVIELATRWDVPVYAHRLEMPYLTGEKDYPEGDPTVGGGMVAEISSSFPHEAIDLGSKIHPLPEDGRIPEMEGWKWIPTPGHTAGHISLFRERDKVIIVGDAFCTLKQESMINVLTQNEYISGPPKYLTTDWEAAEKSVRLIKELNPSMAIVSHGMPMKGEELKKHLELLVKDFDTIAVPEQGRFVE